MVETTTGPAPLNLSKHAEEGLVRSMHLGSKIDREAELETEEGDHPVYLAGSQTDEAGGTIVRLNYALHVR